MSESAASGGDGTKAFHSFGPPRQDELMYFWCLLDRRNPETVQTMYEWNDAMPLRTEWLHISDPRVAIKLRECWIQCQPSMPFQAPNTRIPVRTAEGDPTKYWCIPDPKDASKIAVMFSQGAEHPPTAELLDVTDERVARELRDCLNFCRASSATPKESVIRLSLTSLDELLRLATLFDSGIPKPVFRGQPSYGLNLSPKIERNVPEFVRNEVGLHVYEQRLLNEAQRRLHHYLNPLPDLADHFSWVALMRHHGLPTRLLDVTRSIYIACHFALTGNKAGDDAAIWIFSRHRIDSEFMGWQSNLKAEHLTSSIGTVAQYGDAYYWPIPRHRQHGASPPTLDALRHPDLPIFNPLGIIDAALSGFINRPGVFVAEPFWLSRRIDVQQGSFLVPTNLGASFEMNLASHLNLERDFDDDFEAPVPTDRESLLRLWTYFKVIKLRIPSRLFPALRSQLDAMNISELTMFPDLDGALAHIASHLPPDPRGRA